MADNDALQAGGFGVFRARGTPVAGAVMTA
jgi:hypothetical protein